VKVLSKNCVSRWLAADDEVIHEDSVSWRTLITSSVTTGYYMSCRVLQLPHRDQPNTITTGLDLPRHLWVRLNGFRTGQGHCAANHHTWGLTDNPLCLCGHQLQTMSHIVYVCLSIKFPVVSGPYTAQWLDGRCSSRWSLGPILLSGWTVAAYAKKINNNITVLSEYANIIQQNHSPFTDSTCIRKQEFTNLSYLVLELCFKITANF